MICERNKFRVNGRDPRIADAPNPPPVRLRRALAVAAGFRNPGTPDPAGIDVIEG